MFFDYGGVFTPSPFRAAHAYTQAQGADADADVMVRIVFGAYDTDTDHAWHRLERGFADALSEITADHEAAGLRFDTGGLFSGMGRGALNGTTALLSLPLAYCSAGDGRPVYLSY